MFSLFVISAVFWLQWRFRRNVPYSAAGTWHIHGIAFFCMFPSQNRLYALPLRWKTRILNDQWISSLFQTSAHFFPRLVSWMLRTGDLLIPGSAKVIPPQERLGFRSNRRPYQNSFILRPSPFRLPLSTIPQLFLPITKLPCRNSNSRMLA